MADDHHVFGVRERPDRLELGAALRPDHDIDAALRHVLDLGQCHGRVEPRAPDRQLDAERRVVLAEACEQGKLEASIIPDIRNEIWLKAWGNLSFNPVSALTGATLGAICGDPHGRELVAGMMREASAVAEKLGVSFRVSIDKRIEGAARVGAHKTSMLQDVEAGRAIEVDALVGSVIELGRLVGVDTPAISAIYRAAKLLDATRRRPEPPLPRG